ncbi:MAG: transporter, partial [Candidatus Nephrothrix sp. EaCA]
EYQETERNLFLEVANKWIDVWAAYQELEILKQAKKNIDTLAIINSLRLKNQVIQQTDLLRTELLAKQYDVRLKTSAVEAMTQHYQLKYLLGITDSIRVDTSDYFIRRDIPPLDSLTKQALKNRSDIRAALAQIETAESNIKWQKSLAYPVPELGIIWNPQNSIPYFGFFGTVKLPLFDRNQGEISKAKIAKQQAAFQLSAQQLQVKTEIMSAYAALRVQQENFLKLSDMLAQSKIILSNVRYAYLKGGTTIVDFLEAQRGWLDMQTQYYEMAKMYRQKFIELFYAAQLLNQLAQ